MVKFKQCRKVRRQTRAPTMTSAFYIPPELHSPILLRLPVKSLIRFSSVCKSWKSQITNPNFISSHLNLQINAATKNPNNLPLFITEGDHQHSIWRNGDDFSDRALVGCPWDEFDDLDHKYYLVGTCNGLVCMFQFTGNFYLWNPSIRKSLELQAPIAGYSRLYIMVGLGFDSATNDYKVVVVNALDSLNEDVIDRSLCAQVYSLNSRTWTNNGFPFINLTRASMQFAFFNGVIHWIMCREHDNFHEEASILTFDLNSEAFGELKVPSHITAVEYLMNVCMGVVKDKLALLHARDGECTLFLREDYGKEDSWAVFFKIKLTQTCEFVLCLRNHNELIIILEGGILAFLDPYATPVFCSRYNSHLSDEHGDILPVLESLVLLDKDRFDLRFWNWNRVSHHGAN